MADARRFLADFRTPRGQFPSTLQEALPSPRSAWITDYEHDAWGTPLRYRVVRSGYELRSAGPDRTFETSDDVVVTDVAGTRWG